MRLEQLEAFLLISETGSFQKAAKQCGVTQSTISRQIQSLETELQAQLLHRATPAKLTVAGEMLLPKARRICQDWRQVTQEIADLMAGKQPELCIAAIQSVCSHLLPPVLQHFCQTYPEVQLRVTALGSDRSLKVLRDGLVDVAIVMDNERLTTSADMQMQPLYEEPIEVLMAANHPLTAYDVVPWSALARYPQVVFKDGYGMQRLVQAQFEKSGGIFQAALELNTLEAFRGVVRQGNLTALLPQSALTEWRHDPTLAARPTADPVLSRRVVLVTTCDRLEIPVIQTFCQLVLERGAIFLPHQPTVDIFSLPNP